MKRSHLAALMLCAMLAPAQLFAQEADAKRRAAPEPAPEAEENAKTVSWETDADKASTRSTKEDKRILALFFMAGDG